MIDVVLDLLERAADGADTVHRLFAFWQPVPRQPALLAPLVAAGGAIAFALLTGLAVGALSLFIFAVVALYALLTTVFGISLEVHLP